MWPFSSKKKQPPKPKATWEPLRPLDTSCGGKCDCSFSQVFRYKELPEVIGKQVNVGSIESLPDDVRKALATPFAVGNEVVWPVEGSLPQHTGVMWKHRRAYVIFEVVDRVECPVAGKASTDRMEMFALPHDILLNEIDSHQSRIFIEVLLKDPAGDRLAAEKTGIGIGKAFLFLKKPEEAEYRKALDEYCATNGKLPEDLTFEDGVNCFLGRYLPRQFVVADACLCNLPSFLGHSHFVM